MEYVIEIALGLISAGLLAFCGYLGKQVSNYKKLLAEKNDEHTIELIDTRIKPLHQELTELKDTLLELIDTEDDTRDTLRGTWKYRLIQLCRRYIAQGYMIQSQYDQLSEMYKTYTHFGGNGQGKGYFDKAASLPVYPTEEEAQNAIKGTLDN